MDNVMNGNASLPMHIGKLFGFYGKWGCALMSVKTS